MKKWMEGETAVKFEKGIHKANTVATKEAYLAWNMEILWRKIDAFTIFILHLADFNRII